MGRVLETEVMEGDEEALAYDEFEQRWGDVILQGFAESALTMGVASGRVLDVGCGPGRLAIRLARLNPDFSIEGLDLSHSMLALANRNAAAAGVTNVRFLHGNAKEIPFPNHTFDLVVCHQFLHQLPHPEDALFEIKRVVKPEGAVLVRDVRRLPEPIMTLVMPLWCLGYREKLREQTVSSFRAGLTRAEFEAMSRKVDIERATVATYFATHQGIEREARPFRAPANVRPVKAGLHTRLMKSLFSRRSASRAQ